MSDDDKKNGADEQPAATPSETPGAEPGPAETPESGSAVKLDAFDASAKAPAGQTQAPQPNGAPAEGAAPITAAPAEEPAAPNAPEPEMEADAAGEIAALRAQVSALEDQHLRAVAEIQNIRRRSERDRREAEVFGGTKLARDLLAVFDNLDEALKQASDELKANEPGFFNGVDLTRKVMLDALAKHQITPVNPEIGEKFDPNRHQAMYEAPVPGAAAGSVIQVMQLGFMISDRLLRPAMVGVARGGAPAPKAEDETAAGA